MKGLTQLLLAGTVEKTLENVFGVVVDLRQNAKLLLKKKRKDRSLFDQQRLASFMKDVKFFQQFGPQTDEVRLMCCRYLRFKQVSAGEVVYDFKDKLKHLYILIEGAVEVFNEAKHTSETLHAPSYIGGDAITKKEILDESAICLEECCFGYLTKLDFARVMVQLAEKELAQQADFLNELPMFKDKTKSYLLRLSTAFEEMKYTRNSYVFKQGSAAHYIYFVKEGEFMLTHSLVGHIQTNTAGVAILCRGETLGEKEALEDWPYGNNCICVSAKGKLLALKRETFVKYFVDDDMLSLIKKKTELTEDERSRRIKNYAALINTGRLPSRDGSQSHRTNFRGGMFKSLRQPNYVPTTARQAIETLKPTPIRAPPNLGNTKENEKTYSLSNLSVTKSTSILALESRNRPKITRDLEPIRRVVNIHTDRHITRRSDTKIRLRSRNSFDRGQLHRSLTRQDTSAYKDSHFIMPSEKFQGKLSLGRL